MEKETLNFYKGIKIRLENECESIDSFVNALVCFSEIEKQVNNPTEDEYLALSTAANKIALCTENSIVWCIDNVIVYYLDKGKNKNILKEIEELDSEELLDMLDSLPV